MRIKSLFVGLVAALIATASFAGRGSDGNVSIIYWQAPSILNPYLSGGTKDIESSSMMMATASALLLPGAGSQTRAAAIGPSRSRTTSSAWPSRATTWMPCARSWSTPCHRAAAAAAVTPLSCGGGAERWRRQQQAAASSKQQQQQAAAA